MTDRANNLACNTVIFGPFQLIATERLLVKDKQPVALGGCALDILIALIERAGEVVTRRELLDRVWPNVFVEEANLRVHIGFLRKALADGQAGNRYIINVPGRGYSFVAPIKRLVANGASDPDKRHALPVLQLQTHSARMVGRQDSISALATSLRANRFVSIVGSGGIGKTTVAVAVAHTLADYFSDGICFIDLGSLADGTLVASAVATATGCFVQSHDPLASLLVSMADKKMLLILDNCEHVVESAAELSERLIKEAPEVHLLTTSREALRIEGEHVYLLPPLGVPEADSELTAEKALTYPAVQLFMERAAAAGHRRELDDAEAPLVAEICRRLDGIPLAIELVAGRVGAYGIRGIANLLNEQMDLIWQGRRSALPRQQTLQAMLDWSYHLLSECEQTILRRLSVFADVFTLDAAQYVAGDIDHDTAKVAEALANLVDKSLICISNEHKNVFHRLLYTTRSYVAAKLAASGEHDAIARRHAHYFASSVNSRCEKNCGSKLLPGPAQVANVRSALNWSFSPTGDAAIGIELTARAAPLFIQLSSLGECELWCKRALAALPEAYRETKSELILLEALAISTMFARGNSDEVRFAIERGLNLAETLNDLDHQLHLLAGLNVFFIRIGDFRSALAIANRSRPVAKKSGEITAVIMVEWMLGVAHHLVGNQAAAQCHCERGFELADKARCVNIDFFGYDHRVRALVATARALWLRGHSRRALKFARQAIDEAKKRKHPVSISISHIYSIPIFLWSNDLDEASRHIETLISHTARYSLEPYHAVALALKGELMIASGNAAEGVDLLLNALARFNAGRHHVLTAVFNRALAEGLALCNRFEDAISTIDATIAQSKLLGENFDLPDLLRARGQILSSGPQPDLAAAEEAFIQALNQARKQSAPGWELRAALPLAQIWVRQNQTERARTLLTDIRTRFAEDECSNDLKTAIELLAEIDVPLRRA